MATNRTKIDWAYKQASNIAVMVMTSPTSHPETVRKIAAILRRVARQAVTRHQRLQDYIEDGLN